MRFKKIIDILPDLFFSVLLSALSYFLVSFYSNANYIVTGYYDWLMHAFRVKILQEYGLTSWVHIWANGINMWQSYQLLPHFTTLFITDAFHVSITRAMVLITIAIFLLIRLLIYFILRRENFSPLVSFACSLISLATGMYYVSLSDYTLQFGVLFFLIYVYLWKYYLNGKLNLVFPFLVGLSFYINPVFTFFAGLLWLTGLIFSKKNLISFEVVLEIVVFIIASSWFLYPVVFKSSYLYTNPLFHSLTFLKAQTAKFSLLGFSFSLVVLIPVLLIHIFRKSTEQNWLKVLGIYGLFCILLVILGSTLSLPSFIASFQFTRGVPIISLALCLALAPALKEIIKMGVFKFLLLVFLVFSFGESMWVNKVYAPYPSQELVDPLAKYISLNPDLNNGRFFSPLIDSSSYLAPTTVHFPYSYMEHLDSNQISPRLFGLADYYTGNEEATFSYMNRLSNYFKVTGIQYVLFGQTSPFTKAYLDKNLPLNFKKIDLVNQTNSAYYIFQVPWQPRNAVLIAPSLIQKLDHFPFNINFENDSDNILLDNYIQNFVPLIYDNKNQVLSISYPTQESIIVSIPANRKSNVVYIDESYSKDWKASFNGVDEVVKPVGPNYMAVYLDNNNYSGDLVLKHAWPRNMIIIAIIILLTPIGIGIYNLIILFRRTHEKHKNT